MIHLYDVLHTFHLTVKPYLGRRSYNAGVIAKTRSHNPAAASHIRRRSSIDFLIELLQKTGTGLRNSASDHNDLRIKGMNIPGNSSSQRPDDHPHDRRGGWIILMPSPNNIPGIRPPCI